MTTTVTEKQLQSDIIRLAKAAGWKTYHTHDSRRSEFGFPDLTMVRRDRLVFAELKRELGKPTPEQGAWLYELAGVKNVAVYIWRPQDMKEIERVVL